MLNFANTTTNVVADNKVSFCSLEYLLTDKEATQLKSILDGMVGSRGNTVIGNVADNTVTPVKVTKEYNDVPKHIDNIGYEVRKQVNKVDGKTYYCIAYVAPAKFHMTRDLKSKVNAGIKALDKITEITVDTVKKDGTKSAFKAWGYATKATAEKKIPTLETSFDYIEKQQIK